MQRTRPPSRQTRLVLSALAAEPAAWRHGYDLCRQTGLKAGSMYPILMRLAGQGWLETAWETATVSGRPPRHLYRLTGAGVASAAEIAARTDARTDARAGASSMTSGRPRAAALPPHPGWSQ